MIYIVGAGFSGLSLAYFFTKHGYSVTISDKRARTGGIIESQFKHNMLIESAANGFLASEKIEELFADIGIVPLTTQTESKKKYIFRNGLRRWPLSINETLVLVARLVYAMLTRSFKPKHGELLSTWAHRVLGSAGCDYLIQPMVNGIFAQETSKLSASLVLGSLFFKKRKKTLRGLISAAGGMGEVIQQLETYLKQHGVLFELDQDGKNIPTVLQHNTFWALNFYSAISHFETENIKNTALKKDDFRALSLARVTVTYKNALKKIDGFGVLFPNKESFFSLGVLANTQIFAHRGDYNESWILGDSVAPNLMKMSDQDILEKILTDRKRIFSETVEIKDASIHRWPNVIPSYDFKLESFLESHSDLCEQLTGNYLGVLGLTGIHERNFQLVQSYLERNKK